MEKGLYPTQAHAMCQTDSTCWLFITAHFTDVEIESQVRAVHFTDDQTEVQAGSPVCRLIDIESKVEGITPRSLPFACLPPPEVTERPDMASWWAIELVFFKGVSEGDRY